TNWISSSCSRSKTDGLHVVSCPWKQSACKVFHRAGPTPCIEAVGPRTRPATAGSEIRCRSPSCGGLENGCWPATRKPTVTSSWRRSARQLPDGLQLGPAVRPGFGQPVHEQGYVPLRFQRLPDGGLGRASKQALGNLDALRYDPLDDALFRGLAPGQHQDRQ